MMKKVFATVCLVSMLAIAGCGSTPEKPEERTAAQLYEAGVADLEKGSNQSAIEAFTKIKDWYPFSKYAVEAELKMADAHYGLEAYDQAAMAYESFVNLHPRNEDVPYAIYQIGNCYLEQVKGIDQDQAYAKKALNTFTRLIKQFPDSEYTKPAQAAIKTCRKSIIANEIYIAKFYYKMKNYKAALNRFKSSLDMYPDIGVQFDAMGFIAMCEAELAKSKPEENTEKAPQLSKMTK